MKLNVMLSAAALISSVLLVGCDVGVDDPVSSVSSTTCSGNFAFGSCGGLSVEACVSSSTGTAWYEVGGVRICDYVRSGVAIPSCAERVVDRCNSRPEARAEADLLLELLNTKSENLNLQNQVTDLMNVMNQDIVDSQQAE